MNLLGRPAAAAMGTAFAAVATLATTRILAHNWMGCATHLEPGSRAALLLFAPLCFGLLAAGGAIAGLLTRGIRRHLEDPEFLRLFAVALGITLTALTLGTLLTGPATTGCPAAP
ncbi:hypothetical protein [Kitasatospora sp. NPDC059673]|uniref:hypothetical protein n=1 Tax=Kitasatospora sp. NPDC059673 TaxID=3346901 RepID=UPI00369980DC